jgi:hypothetical protein
MMSEEKKEIIEFCPLDKTCETIVDTVIHRCKWYIPFASTNTKGETIEKWRCTATWISILQIEALEHARKLADK